MPIKMERALMRSAKKKGIKKGSRRWGAYVYGTVSRFKKRGKA